MFYHIDMYNANNRLLFFLLREKPQATVSEHTMNIYIQRKWKMNTCMYIWHLQQATDFSFFMLFLCFKSTFLSWTSTFKKSQTTSTFWLLHEKRKFLLRIKIAKSYKVCPVGYPITSFFPRWVWSFRTSQVKSKWSPLCLRAFWVTLELFLSFFCSFVAAKVTLERRMETLDPVAHLCKAGIHF